MQMDIKRCKRGNETPGLIVLRTKDLLLGEVTRWPGSSTYRLHRTESWFSFRGEWKKLQSLGFDCADNVSDNSPRYYCHYATLSQHHRSCTGY